VKHGLATGDDNRSILVVVVVVIVVAVKPSLVLLTAVVAVAAGSPAGCSGCACDNCSDGHGRASVLSEMTVPPVIVVHDDDDNSNTVATRSGEKNIVAFTVPAASEKKCKILWERVYFMSSGVPRIACQSTTNRRSSALPCQKRVSNPGIAAAAGRAD
jgi:hypothetical protein